MFKNMRLLGDMESEGVLSLLLYTAEFQHGRQGAAAPTIGASARPDSCGGQGTAAPTIGRGTQPDPCASRAGAATARAETPRTGRIRWKNTFI